MVVGNDLVMQSGFKGMPSVSESTGRSQLEFLRRGARWFWWALG